MEELIKQFGFPVATAVFFIYQYIKDNKAHKDDLKGIAQVSVAALDRNTVAIDNNSEELAKSSALRDKNVETLDRVRDTLIRGEK